MNHQLISPRRLAALLIVAASLPLSANTSTNTLPPLPAPRGTNHLAAAERRARIEAWRAERGGTNRTAVAAPPENTRHLPAAERRARIRAKLDELRAKKMSGLITPAEQNELTRLETFSATNAPAASLTNLPAARRSLP